MRFRTFYRSTLLEDFAPGAVEQAIGLIQSYLERKTGQKLYREAGVDEFVNDTGRHTGIRFFIGNTTGAVRLNFTGGTVTGVDVWTPDSEGSTPSAHIDMPKNFSVVKTLPALVSALIDNPTPHNIELLTVTGDILPSEGAELQGEAAGTRSIKIGGKVYTNASEAIVTMLRAGKSKDEIRTVTGSSDANIYRVARKEGLVSQIAVVRASPESTPNTAAVKAVESLPEYADPKVVFDDMRDLVAMVLNKTQPSLIITGGAGQGKTFGVTKQIEEAGLKRNSDWIHSKGHASPFGLYRTLYENRKILIVFDDCDSILKDPVAVNILKAALDSYDVREITWKSKSTFNPDNLDDEEIDARIEDGRLPDHFEFDGRIIFISNLHINQFDAAVRSRSFAIDLSLKAEDVLLRIESILEKIAPDAPMPIKQKALEYMKKNMEKITKGSDTINMRTFLNTVKIMQSGSENWERLVDKYALS